jgi:hypothetical protein
MAAVGDIWRLTHVARDTSNQNPIVNTFHFRAATVDFTAAALVADWIATIVPLWRPAVSGLTQMVRVRADSLVPYGEVPTETLNATVGSLITRSLPASVTARITWRTGIPGRRYRGRTFLSRITHEQCTDGRLGTTYMNTELTNYANGILNRYGPTGTYAHARIGVWSRVLGNEDPPHNPAGFTPITSFTLQESAGVMSTRRWGR